MQLSKVQKFIYYYIKFSLIVYPFLLSIAVISRFWIPNLPEDVFETFKTILLSLFIPCFLAFWILPGIIYNGRWEGSLYGLKLINIKYNLFLFLTLGLGPTYIFFKKYNPIFKDHIRHQSRKRTKS